MSQKTEEARKSVTGQRARNPEEKELVRQQILQNALELYVEAGYQGFSMRKLATRTGFSASSLYRYFEHKDAVFAGLVDLGFQRMEVALSKVQGSDLRSYLNAYAKAYLEFALTESELYKLMTSDHPPSSVHFANDTTDRRWRVFAAFGKKVDALGLSGVQASVNDSAATDALWAFAHGLASLTISLPYFSQQRMDETLDFVFKQVDPFIGLFIQSNSVTSER